MAKYIPKGQVNNKEVIKKLTDWAKALNRNISIKVGIVGPKAREKHPGTDLNNAELGAVHEFGATINHPGGQPYYINSSTGMAVFVKKDSFLGQFLIAKGQVTKPHKIVIPTRSFLRGSLLTPEGKKVLLDAVQEHLGTQFEAKELSSDVANKALDEAAHLMAEVGTLRVKKAFTNNGFGNWKPTSPASKKQRKYNQEAATLVDSGQLEKSINYEITERPPKK